MHAARFRLHVLNRREWPFVRRCNQQASCFTAREWQKGRSLVATYEMLLSTTRHRHLVSISIHAPLRCVRIHVQITRNFWTRRFHICDFIKSVCETRVSSNVTQMHCVLCHLIICPVTATVFWSRSVWTYLRRPAVHPWFLVRCGLFHVGATATQGPRPFRAGMPDGTPARVGRAAKRMRRVARLSKPPPLST